MIMKNSMPFPLDIAPEMGAEAIAQQQADILEAAFRRQDGEFKVKLSNVGNPDFRQDPKRKLPDTICGLVGCDSIKEAVNLCRAYIAHYDLGGGNWSGGEIKRADGSFVGQVSYNGRVWADKNWTPQTNEVAL